MACAFFSMAGSGGGVADARGVPGGRWRAGSGVGRVGLKRPPGGAGAPWRGGAAPGGAARGLGLDAAPGVAGAGRPVPAARRSLARRAAVGGAMERSVVEAVGAGAAKKNQKDSVATMVGSG